MAYTNETANDIVDFLHSNAGYEMPRAIASAVIITQDVETLDGLDEEKLNHIMTELHNMGDAVEVSIKHVTELLNKK